MLMICMHILVWVYAVSLPSAAAADAATESTSHLAFDTAAAAAKIAEPEETKPAISTCSSTWPMKGRSSAVTAEPATNNPPRADVKGRTDPALPP